MWRVSSTGELARVGASVPVHGVITALAAMPLAHAPHLAASLWPTASPLRALRGHPTSSAMNASSASSASRPASHSGVEAAGSAADVDVALMLTDGGHLCVLATDAALAAARPVRVVARYALAQPGLQPMRALVHLCVAPGGEAAAVATFGNRLVVLPLLRQLASDLVFGAKIEQTVCEFWCQFFFVNGNYIFTVSVCACIRFIVGLFFTDIVCLPFHLS